MARYTGAACKLCRREQTKMFLKGIRCVSDKCAMERRNVPPGGFGKRRPKLSEYAVQLREKQHAKREYGLLEKQFRNYYKFAVKQKGITGENLLRALETRLDNVVYRLGFANSRREARQLIRHGHFRVNERKVNIPSAQVKPGDSINVAAKSMKMARIKFALESSARGEVPGWLEVDPDNMAGRVLDLPTRDQIDLAVQEQLIVELYSK